MVVHKILFITHLIKLFKNTGFYSAWIHCIWSLIQFFTLKNWSQLQQDIILLLFQCLDFVHIWILDQYILLKHGSSAVYKNNLVCSRGNLFINSQSLLTSSQINFFHKYNQIITRIGFEGFAVSWRNNFVCIQLDMFRIFYFITSVAIMIFKHEEIVYAHI